MNGEQTKKETFIDMNYSNMITTLRQLAIQLGTIAMETENEFLKVGENLYACSFAGMECSNHVTSLLEAINSDANKDQREILLQKLQQENETFISTISEALLQSNTLIQKNDLKVKLEVINDSTSLLIDEISTSFEEAKLFCNRTADRASRITPEIGEVVSAIQFHDITRQQMEHAGKSLSDIAEKTASLQGRDGDERIMLNHWISKALEIQKAQLDNVAKETTKAAENISSHLLKVSGLILEQAEDANAILGESGQDSTQKAEELSKLLSDISSNIKEMSLTIADTPVQEACMNVKESNETNNSGGTTEEMKEIVKNNFDNLAGLIHDFSRDTNEAVEKLFRHSGELKHSINEILAEAEKLNTEILGVISMISFDKTIKNRIGTITTEIDNIRFEVNQCISDSACPVEFTPDLAELLERYTMQSERQVHEAVMEGVDLGEIDLFGMDETGESSDNEAAEDNGGDELGDNVELF